MLWDKTLDVYKDRNATRNAWKDVCCEINTDFEDMEDKEKNEFGEFSHNLIFISSISVHMSTIGSVSYTHLDVYKRQTDKRPAASVATHVHRPSQSCKRVIPKQRVLCKDKESAETGFFHDAEVALDNGVTLSFPVFVYSNNGCNTLVYCRMYNSNCTD